MRLNQLNLGLVLAGSHLRFLEITHPSASKGQALRWVIQQMGLAPADILAGGDGQND